GYLPDVRKHGPDEALDDEVHGREEVVERPDGEHQRQEHQQAAHEVPGDEVHLHAGILEVRGQTFRFPAGLWIDRTRKGTVLQATRTALQRGEKGTRGAIRGYRRPATAGLCPPPPPFPAAPSAAALGLPDSGDVRSPFRGDLPALPRVRWR